MESQATSKVNHHQRYILVLYYSQGGSTANMAREIALGIESASIEARLRRLESPNNPNPEDPVLICDHQDLINCAALALGSPTRFGNMSGVVKNFLDTTGKIWMQGNLQNKPACVFSSCSSAHGGHESTLLSMMIPLFHHGMIICGLPYDTILRNTTGGGTPYGATHLARDGNSQLSDDEKQLCRSQGKRLARIVLQATNTA